MEENTEKRFRIIFKDGRELTVSGASIEQPSGSTVILKSSTNERTAAFYLNHSEVLGVFDESVLVSEFKGRIENDNT